MLWMTSAAELFHSRRYRFGVRHTAVDVSGIDSSPADATSSYSSSSSSSHQHRTTIRRHGHHYSSQNNRREIRLDHDGCDPPSRRIHRRRLDYSEHEQVHPEQSRSQSPSGSITNSHDFRSIHRRRAAGSDRLPGSVLLARERLVERLRGVSVSGYRRTSGSSSNTNRDDFLSIGSENNMVDEMASDSWQTLETTRKHPPGLDQYSLNCLHLEIFRTTDESSSELRECTICLEGFQDGEKLIRLNCMHVFHSCCLLPWVRVCGACPNCRKAIVVNNVKPLN